MVTRREMLAAAGLLAPCAASAAESVAKFPFRVTRNTPWTAVHVNGKEPGLPFMLDTGASAFGILNSKARELALPRRGSTLAQATIGRTQVAAYVADLVVGGAVRYDETFMFGLDRELPVDLQGLIPLTRFNAMAFDFDALEITVTRRTPERMDGYMPLETDPGEADEGSLDRLGAFTTSEAYQSVRDHRPVVAAEFDGQPVKLLIDTGAQGGLFLYPDYVKARGLWDHYPRPIESGIRTVAADGRARIVRAERFKLGRVVFANPLVLLGDPADSHHDGNSVADGVVGMEFLRRLNFLNDPKRGRLWIKPNKAIADGYRIDRTGADVQMVEGEGRVVFLREGGPADRGGLRLGDKITGWRGRDGIEGLAWAMRGAPGSKVEIQVEREGRPQMVAVTLEDPI